MDAKWYIVNTLSGSEHKVCNLIKKFAEKRGVSDKLKDIVIPIEQVTEVRKGKKVTGEKKFFPGYIFIKMQLDDETWNMVKNIPKVTDFLNNNGKPLPVPEREVMAVLKQIEEGAIPKELEVGFEVGDTLKIMDGPFATFVGTVEEVDLIKKKVRVLVSIFGRTTPVDLDFDQVELIK